MHAICIWFLFGLINRTYTQITLPWSTCPIGADNVTVVECADSSETQYFWFRLKSSLFANLNFSFFYSQIFSFDCKLLGLLWMRRGALVLTSSILTIIHNFDSYMHPLRLQNCHGAKKRNNFLSLFLLQKIWWGSSTGTSSASCSPG